MKDKKISNEAMICSNCQKPFMALKSIGIDDFPIIDDQPCPYCLTSKSGKKFDKNGKEIN